MGCSASQNADAKATRVARWRSTGIVALRDSKLKTFPDEILDLDQSVRTLDLTHNRIRMYFPPNYFIFYLIKSRVKPCILVKEPLFECCWYSVAGIPMEMSKLINLQRLILAHNLIESLPVNLGKLQSLKIMILDGNRITSLPDELGQLVKLEQLSISGNLLTCLPVTIGSMRNLVILNVSNNKLKSLPESVGSCFSLEELQANNNLIEDLPPSVCNLTNLKSLSLDNNNVKQIPMNLLKDCKALQNISLHNNPISMDQFQQMDGFQEFEARRRKKFDKQIDSNVMISSKGLDEGVDL